MVIAELDGNIRTNVSGFNKIIGLYNKLKKYKDQEVVLDLYHLNWIDANLCALLQAIMHKLHVENQLTFMMDFPFVMKKFDVLFRNGFGKTKEIEGDDRKSTVPLRGFDCHDIEGFESYINEDLLCHRGMKGLSEGIKKQMRHDLIEVFNNVELHAGTDYPVFICGQYYPNMETVKLTIVDLGEGFLPKIKEVTKNSEKPIKLAKDAIRWAVSGNSVKMHTLCEPGGLGISGMYEYFEKKEGEMHIISGDSYWESNTSTDLIGVSRKLENRFVGTMINLFFGG